MATQVEIRQFLDEQFCGNGCTYYLSSLVYFIPLGQSYLLQKLKVLARFHQIQPVTKKEERIKQGLIDKSCFMDGEEERGECTQSHLARLLNCNVQKRDI